MQAKSFSAALGKRNKNGKSILIIDLKYNTFGRFLEYFALCKEEKCKKTTPVKGTFRKLSEGLPTERQRLTRVVEQVTTTKSKSLYYIVAGYPMEADRSLDGDTQAARQHNGGHSTAASSSSILARISSLPVFFKADTV